MGSKSKLVGKYVSMKGNSSDWSTCDWGVIVDYDGDWYHLAMYGDLDFIPVFTRDEFRVPMNPSEWELEVAKSVMERMVARIHEKSENQ